MRRDAAGPGLLLVVVATASVVPPPASTRPRPADAAFQVVPDSVAYHRAARDAQARFERLRLRHVPRGAPASGGPCDERVGRFCTRYDEGDWAPHPDPPELQALREDLLAELDSVARLLPGDDWVAGQRVWYRAEAGAWEDALTAARGCRATPWWCHALRGLALHGSGRYQEAEDAFGSALEGMELRESLDWRFPLRAVDGEGRELLEALRRGDEEAEEGPSAGATDALLDRFWLLADPLWLVPGNDRKTGHYARWTVSMIRVGARNPYGLSWGRDLEELTVRHGWELGWERGWPEIGRETDVVGHKHPEGRDFFPPGSAVLDPAGATEGELRADRTRPRSLYAPAYAPLLLPLDGQVAVFPRGDSMAVVATHHLPSDTSWHRTHTHPRPWLEAGDQAGLPERAGLFLAPAGPALRVGDGRVRAVEGSSGGNVPGAPAAPSYRDERVAPSGHGLVVQAPAGRWVVSVERWSPGSRRAGRLRRGLVVEATPPDVATLSDLLLVAAGPGEPATLAEAAARALPRAALDAGEAFGVVWEVGGLGWRREELRYTLSLRKEGGNLLERAGRWLGLLGQDEPLRLSWEETAPERPGYLLRHVEVDPGVLEAGRYRLLLELRAPGRAPLRSRRLLEVRESNESPGAH